MKLGKSKLINMDLWTMDKTQSWSVGNSRDKDDILLNDVESISNIAVITFDE